MMSGSALEHGRSGREYAEPNRELGGISLGSHVAYLFEDSAEKQNKLFQIVDQSLQDPSASVFYIAGKQGVKGIRFSLKDYGIDVGSIEKQKRIKIVDSQEWYLSASKTPDFKSTETVLAELNQLATTQTEAGYYYLTVISETDFIVRKGFFRQYREFEVNLGRKLKLNRAIFICAYDERELTAAGLDSSIKSDLSTLHASTLK